MNSMEQAMAGVIETQRRPQMTVVEGGAVGQVIAFANQKGGVAKTTTTLNLGVALAERGKRVLAVDLDPQSNLTMSQGIDPEELDRTMFDVLVHKTPIDQIIE
jgi:chromosome partitioning protein